jgi:hypothetical protein
LKYRVAIPVEIKLLICLRILGRGECTDTIVECSGVRSATVNRIFKTFLRNFRQYKHIFIPEPTEDDIIDNMLKYNQLGLPGAIGSVDCTHLHWRMCPTELYNYCKNGKYSYATVAFQVCVNHSRKVMSVSEMFYGAHNDNTINRYDEFVSKVADKKLFQDIEFVVAALDGTVSVLKGVYFITDNGYIKDHYFMMPSKIFMTTKEMYWSEWMESVRKDVECFFGALKQRFRILMNGINYHSKETIEQLFVVACMLHNIILGYDSDGSTDWEKDVNWENLHPDENAAEDGDDQSEQEITAANCFYEAHQDTEAEEARAIEEYNHSLENRMYYKETIDEFITSDALITTSHGVKNMWSNTEYKQLILINHYAVMYKNGMVSWPKAFDARLKTLCPIRRNAIAERVITNQRSEMVDIARVRTYYHVLFIFYIIFNYFIIANTSF